MTTLALAVAIVSLIGDSHSTPPRDIASATPSYYNVEATSYGVPGHMCWQVRRDFYNDWLEGLAPGVVGDMCGTNDAIGGLPVWQSVLAIRTTRDIAEAAGHEFYYVEPPPPLMPEPVWGSPLHQLIDAVHASDVNVIHLYCRMVEIGANTRPEFYRDGGHLSEAGRAWAADYIMRELAIPLPGLGRDGELVIVLVAILILGYMERRHGR